MLDITVVVCTIAPRAKVLVRALESVTQQDQAPSSIIVSYDHERGGHAYNRNKALAMVNTEFVAFLDDDDTLLPHHLSHLSDIQQTTGADLVYPWHNIINNHGDILPDLLTGRGREFDPDELRRNNFIPVTVLARTSAIRKAGGFPVSGPGKEWYQCEDWGCWTHMLDQGCTFVHTPEVTWNWMHWGFGKPGEPGNTSGQGDRW